MSSKRTENKALSLLILAVLLFVAALYPPAEFAPVPLGTGISIWR
jgi:hypothetical protein